ncbi:hypothetical protein KI116_002136 [Enterococcus hirae]|nr:hypothetical protein [Enterococcus hirae]EMF0391878.1 hypothetical protein [Enterococcus hirae]EMF0594106.1 hypothetical protein [Enterococcus faecium]
MSNLKVGDIVFYKGDEGIIREVMTDGKENFYRVDVSRKSILYLSEDELDLGTQKLNENQKIVLEWLKWSVKEQGNSAIDAIFLLRTGEAFDSVLLALKSLNNQQQTEVLAAFAQWGLRQEEKE